jgi:hypothetical protein
MPQIVFGPFMAGTMVEDAHAVKPLFPGGESPRPAAPDAVADAAVNAGLTALSHSYAPV